MMAKRIAQFHKVSFEQFAEGFQDTFGEMKENLSVDQASETCNGRICRI